MVHLSAFLGMDLIWWAVFLVIVIWIFIVPFDIPGQRKRMDSALEILKTKFAAGDITKEEFKRESNLLKGDPGNKPYKKTVK